MTWFFLIYFTLSVAGVPSANPVRIYENRADCESAGLVADSHVRANEAVKHGIWQCMPVDFAKITSVPDPLLRGPVPEEPKRLPARPPGQRDA